MAKQNRFDELMFGKKTEEESKDLENNEEENESFDLFKTVELLNDTYQKLSPLKDMFKSIKK
ncbi:hypothetical protein ACTNEO_00815 [Gracilibacillus sp. HCP3S3_G5_1]|uniref:hypothetical protein n=1 Tax=unclassified Gracilibacillus TaxID=2625209 RepID=UPI003F88867E